MTETALQEALYVHLIGVISHTDMKYADKNVYHTEANFHQS